MKGVGRAEKEVAVLLPTLRRGDVVQVTWKDIAEDPTGDPERAALASGRNTLGFFWGETTDEVLAIPCIVLTSTLDHDVVGQGGYSIFPVALVQSVRVIRRSRNAATTRRKKQQPPQHSQGGGAMEGAGYVGGGDGNGGQVG